MKEKQYKTIKQVSDLLKIRTHVIRYWDSKFDNISTRLSGKKHRFFNKENIKKIKELKSTLYANGKLNYTLDLANQIVSNKNKEFKKINHTNSLNLDKSKNKIFVNELKLLQINLKKILDL